MRLRFLILPAMVGALAGCQTGRDTAKKNPEAGYNRCIAAVAVWSITLKHETSAFMGVSQERMPSLFCQRLRDAVLSGRITASDINSLQLNQPTEIWKVIKGK
ncbi:MAG: hypothetical protein EOQ86_11500 [Mesorhizobium sp.]|uniref:hypothetical protein n=1 Tax=Mesorhizobium sp. TaxID=1871066 RepID=UPI000FE99163|nr:hypothetical protein [Mesorhizobium sp.]RWH70706.1 MAG: hypothetical protein EOQ85_30540 [Mesorhizobium sp.]RWH83070.1 MAG: hypothetical protein EOQ86_11500 [Mesorhizobium sp.]RWH91681.1 MAG: hypothetical protein EOQ87_05615 [Mesorhizobium sp.]RWH92357.1 MAG: hypothetical protein EOQ88_30690 [Mesorhizobium sp.]RWI06214.1 MAG: hypothetical protein EOQ89_00145 [Mesorhizobium sp.]